MYVRMIEYHTNRRNLILKTKVISNSKLETSNSCCYMKKYFYFKYKKKMPNNLKEFL